VLRPSHRAHGAILALLFGAAGAHAQVHRSANVAMPCRQIESREQVDRAMQMLASNNASLIEGLRSIGVTPQPADAPGGVLRSASACARLRASLRKVIRDADMPAEGLTDAPLSFLELGQYYGVIVTSGRKAASGLRRAGAAPLYLFDRRNVEFIARLAL
jgi:hypothetical protein